MNTFSQSVTLAVANNSDDWAQYYCVGDNGLIKKRAKTYIDSLKGRKAPCAREHLSAHLRIMIAEKRVEPIATVFTVEL